MAMPLGAMLDVLTDKFWARRRVSLVGAVDFPLVARLGTELLPSDLASLSCSLFCKQCAFFMFPTLPDSQMTPFKSKTNSRPPTHAHGRGTGEELHIRKATLSMEMKMNMLCMMKCRWSPTLYS